MDLVFMIWFLVGFIVGMFCFMLVVILYEENYTIKIEKEQRYILDEVQKDIQMGKGRKNLKFVK
jgi:nucleoside recognition membrane protein YjiH